MKKTLSFSVRSACFFADSACLCALMALLLCFPKESAAGVTAGLRLCFSSLIGALLPFLVVSSLFLKRGLHRRLPLRHTPITNKLFALPSCCAPVVVFSMVGGYPVGASMTARLVSAGELTQRQGQRMLLFCVGPGPAFVLSAVGVSMLGSAKAGVVLYASVVAGALLTGVVTRPFLKNKAVPTSSLQEKAPPPFAVCVGEAVRESADAMVLICAFVALFSALLAVLAALQLPPAVFSAAEALIEVTRACGALSKQAPLPFLAAAIAWGGVCTHCQLSPFFAALRLRYLRFACGRALHAGLSFLCCRGLLCFVKLPTQALMQQAAFRPSQRESPLLSVCMLIMCALLLCGTRLSVRPGLLFSRNCDTMGAEQT